MRYFVLPFINLILIAFGIAFACTGSRAQDQTNLWQFAKQHADTHRFSTLFTAHDVKNHLTQPEGLQKAIGWCKQTGVTKVYIEEFRDGYRAEKSLLENARDTFRTDGFEVSGCVTTTSVGKPSTGWKEVACCYTDHPEQSSKHFRICRQPLRRDHDRRFLVYRLRLRRLPKSSSI